MVLQFQDFKTSEFAGKPHFLVVGHPVGHSLSPLMHQKALDYYRIAATYIAVDLKADEITDFTAWCARESFLGCNITIPHKEAFLNIVDTIDPVAGAIGVINTVVIEHRSNHHVSYARSDSVSSDPRILKGYNTDIYGFMSPLENEMGQLEGARVIIFGTGGASRAVKTALIGSGVREIIFVSRSPQVKEKEIENDGVYIQTVGYDQWPSFADEALLFVNTTPVGMFPHIHDLFIREEESSLFKGKICYDLIYNPLQTRFLALAEKAGAKTINGLDMLVHQGSKSFELWTGRPFPLEIVKEILLNHFKAVL